MDKFTVAFSTDHTAAYLLVPIEGAWGVFARWMKGRPDISNFDPARWHLGQASAAKGGTFYDAQPVSGYF